MFIILTVIIALSITYGGVQLTNFIERLSQVESTLDTNNTIIEQSVNTPDVSVEETIPVTENIVLSNLNVGEIVKDGSYNVKEFGKWVDTDGNGCDTRNDILARDLVDAVSDSNCKVQFGTLNDIYTGTSIQFVYGEGACTKSAPGVTITYDDSKVGGCSNAVPIEHIFPREAAWYAGAKNWSYDERVLFSNDMGNLVASINLLNSVKGGKTPSELVAKSLTEENGEFYVTTKAGVNYDMSFNACFYAETYTNIASKYNLVVSPADVDALALLSTGCVG